MIVRITNRGHQHYQHYGIVYKIAENFGRHQILFIKDAKGELCMKSGFATTNEFEEVPDEENRDAAGWPPALCDTVVHTAAGDLASLIRDGRKYRQIKQLWQDET